jgi:hypothetical protein
MFLNISKDQRVYECNEHVMRWFVYEKHLPVLSFTKNGKYYFRRTELFEECLKDMPLHIKFLSYLR